MKCLLFSLFVSGSVFALPGEFVCRRSCALYSPPNGYCAGSAEPRDTARVLNEMNCDTSKSVTVAPEVIPQANNRVNTYFTVCYVEKSI